jgi:hypothetical protein
VDACCNVRAAAKKFWCAHIATVVSVTAAQSAANRHDWPTSAQPLKPIRTAEPGAAIMPVAKDACVRDSANASKNNS